MENYKIKIETQDFVINDESQKNNVKIIASKGDKGDPGVDGQDGYTPIKGVDYFTQEDIDDLNIPRKISELQNDSGYITNETDPIYSQSVASNITANDITSWNNKSDFSGDYDDLTNKPAIPTKTSDLNNDAGFINSSALDDYVTTNTAQDITSEKTIKSPLKVQNGNGTGSLWIGGDVNASSLTNNTRHLARIVVPSYSNITVGATLLGFDTSGDSDMSITNKGSDVVSFGGMKKISNATSPMAIGFCVANSRGATASADKTYPMEMDKSEVRFNVKPTYNGNEIAIKNSILSYGNSTWTDFINAYNSNSVVYCRASSNSNPASGSQTRLAFMAYVNNAENPTEVEFQYYRSVSSHSDSQQGDQVFVYKLNKTNGWSVTTRNAFTKIVAGTGLKSTYSNGVLTISLDS